MSLKRRKIVTEGLWENNPIFRMTLGLCSTLAVTNLVKNTVIMSVSVLITLILNSVITSLLRRLIPERVRMIAYMVITSTLVIMVDMALKIFLPDISRQLGPYVALIITNCIIMGRAEAFAINNGVMDSFLDALSVGTGYSLSLITLALVREFMGFGTIWGFEITANLFEPFKLLTIPPGAFFMLGFLILITNIISRRRKR